MEYELRVWTHFQMIKNINTYDIEELKSHLKLLLASEDYGEYYVEIYINSKKLTNRQCIKLYKELGLR